MKIHLRHIPWMTYGLLCFSAAPLTAQFQLDAETGGVFSGYNDVRVPNETGTLFSISKDLASDAKLFYRIRFSLGFSRRHTLSILFAPLTIKASGQVNRDILFEDQTFPANTPLEGVYRFNSYRLTYRYDLLQSERVVLGIGLTGKIRDAEIKLTTDGLEANTTDVGFVPLLHLRFFWKWGNHLGFLAEADAAAAPQGRAEDVLAALVITMGEKWDLKAGYRILEGGADVDQVYNFALIHYIVVGSVIRL
jgi:hypothetical protein